MELVVIVLNKIDLLDEMLSQFMKFKIQGATVIDSSGMGHLISNQFPMFSMFAELGEEREANSKTIFTVVKDEDERKEVLSVVESVCGKLEEPDTAIFFSVPVNFTKGLRKDGE
ncbi:hypothetical protein ADIAL_0125 [Alkalibacterium sp. AK22]|uniref:hypothetical protein n=1 Tax=Alkalibacterium sp. AK22 TaxID=1229520 RepID=UPI00044D8170|nr:hypothetical protein [Alkalibacterium sp. AK22]EXJ24386.1 hypothetical protein ADIAL_0125 [Alkalibacterium sp. AK22]